MFETMMHSRTPDIVVWARSIPNPCGDDCLKINSLRQANNSILTEIHDITLTISVIKQIQWEKIKPHNGHQKKIPTNKKQHCYL